MDIQHIVQRWFVVITVLVSLFLGVLLQQFRQG